jgi:CBS domain containing-hemolysin-like protein
VVQGMLGGSIYTIGARRRGVQMSRGSSYLSELSVAQALDAVAPIPAELPYAELLRLVAATPHAAFPVVDGGGAARILSVREARRALLDPAVDRSATAGTFAHPAKPLFADDDLATAVQTLADAGVSEALVLDADGKPLGVVTREGILEAWHRVTLAG